MNDPAGAEHRTVSEAALRRTALREQAAAEAFDRLARLAAAMLGAPMVIVPIRRDDGAYVVRGSAGLPQGSDFPVPLRPDCCPALRDGTPGVVGDAQGDASLAALAVALDVPIGAYAGVPLHAMPGSPPLGAVCVVDRAARAWGAAELAQLRDLAAAIAAEVELLAARRIAEASERRLRFLADASTILSAQRGLEAALQQLAWLSVPMLGDLCAIDALGADTRLQRLASAHIDPERELLLREPEGYVLEPDSRLAQAHTLRRGQPAIIPVSDETVLERLARDAAHRERLRALAPTAVMCLPLLAHGRVVGLMTLAMAESERRYDAEDLELAEELARRAAGVIENARLYREAEEATRRREEAALLLDLLLERAPLGFALLDRDLRYVRVNSSFAALDRRPPEAHVGRRVDEVVPETGAVLVPLIQRTLAAGEPVHNIELEGSAFGDPADRRRWLASICPVRAADGSLAGVGIITTEITDRVRSMEAMQRQALVFESLSDGVIVMDVEGLVTDWNRAAERIFGYTREEMLGRSPAVVHHPRVGERLERQVQDALRREGRWEGEIPYRRKDGAEGVVDAVIVSQRDAQGREIGRVGVNRDITERRRLEQQLRVSQRLEAVGRLAGGIAHDFNNLLTVIGTSAELLRTEMHVADRRREQVEEIARAAERASALTRQLLAFSRARVLQPRVLDLNAVVAEMERMLRRLIGEHIELRAELADDLAPVLADPTQIEQVIANLVVNARDAMPGGGRITIETRNETLGPGSPVPLPPGPCVAMVVRDAGHGMDAAVLEHIFEPFFTTKPAGQGTGLGLATVYGIVQQAGGHITVTSYPGEGSTFTIHLPRAAAGPGAGAEPPPADPGRGRGETVLLAEDEEPVRRLVRQVLVRAGYRVLEAPSGDAALAIAERHGGGIDLLLTDVIMPGMDGRALRDRVRALRPDLRVLFMSGYTGGDNADLSSPENGSAFLPKPFAIDALTRAVRELLDAPPLRGPASTTP